MTEGTLAEMVVSIGADISKFDKEVKKLEKGFQPLADKLTSIGGFLSKYLTLPLLAVSGASVKVAGDFESAMNRVSALGEIAGRDLDRLRKQALQLGKDTKFSAGEAALAMGELAAAGFDTNQIYAAMPGVLALAAAGEMAVADAAEIAANIMGGFGLNATEAGRAADVLAKAAAEGTVDVRELGLTMKYVGPVAQAAGLQFEEVAAAATLLSNAGIKGEQSGTSLRGMLASLLAPSAAAAAAIERVGLVVMDSSGKMLPLSNIVQQLGEKGASTTDIFEIFGRESASAVQALVTGGAPALDKMTGKLLESEGAAKQMADTMNQGFKGGWEQVTGSVETFAIALGTLLLPAATKVFELLTSMINVLTDVVGWFGNTDPVIQAVVGVLVALVAAAGPVLVVLGSIVAILPSLAAGFQLLGISGATAMATVRTALISSGIGALLVGLGTAAYLVIDNWDAVSAFFVELFHGIRLTVVQALDGMLGAIEPVARMFSDKLGDSIAGVRTYLQDMGTTSVKALASMATSSKETSGEVDQLTESVGNAGAATVIAAQGITQFGGASEDLQKALTELEKNLKSVEARRAILGNGFNTAAAEADALEGGLTKLVQAGLSPVSEKFVELKGRLDAAKQAANAFEKEERLKKIHTDLRTQLDRVNKSASVFTNETTLNAERAKVLQAAISALIGEGVDPMDAAVVRMRLDLARARGELDGLGVDSASVLKDWKNNKGDWDVPGTALAKMDANARDVRRAVEDLNNDGGFFSKAWGAALGTVNNLFRDFREKGLGGILAGIGDLKTNLGPGLGGALQGVLSASGPWGAALSGGLKLMEAFGLDINKIFSKIAAFGQGVFKKIGGAVTDLLGIGGKKTGGNDLGASQVEQLLEDLSLSLLQSGVNRSDLRDNVYQYVEGLVKGDKTFESAYHENVEGAMASATAAYNQGETSSFAGPWQSVFQSIAMQMLEDGQATVDNLKQAVEGNMKPLFDRDSNAKKVWQQHGSAWLQEAVAMFKSSAVPFAEGGIAMRPTWGVFGEAGAEAILPLKKLPDLMRSMMPSMGRMSVPSTGYGDASQTIIFKIGDREVARAAVRGMPGLVQIHGVR